MDEEDINTGDTGDSNGGDVSNDMSVDDAAALLLGDETPDEPAPTADPASPAPPAESVNPAGPAEPADLVEAAAADGSRIKIPAAELSRLAAAHLPPPPGIDPGMAQQYQAVIQAGLQQLQGQEIRPFTAAEIQKILAEDPIEGPGLIQLRTAQAAEWRDKHDTLLAAQAEEQRRQHDDMARHLAAEHAKLLTAIPEWRDPAKKAAHAAELTGYLKKSGFSPAEISQAYDHRAIVLADKARRYDELMAKGATQQVRGVPAYVKPGAAPAAASAGRQSAENRFLKTGRVEDAAALLMS